MTDMADSIPTRERILDAAMRLFGELGYTATTISQIESAAGLRPGSGGLYRHFASKRELLTEGVSRQVNDSGRLAAAIGDPSALAGLELRVRLTAVVEAAMGRLDQDRDLNRIILRDLREFPDLAELVRTRELRRAQDDFATWLQAQPEFAEASGVDWPALATALVGSVSHYWVLRDALGEHPSGVDATRYTAAVVDLLLARMAAAT